MTNGHWKKHWEYSMIMKKTLLTILTLLCMTFAGAQNKDYLQKAERYLNEGDCKRARISYDVYKNSGGSDRNVEQRINDCNKNKGKTGKPVKVMVDDGGRGSTSMETFTETAFGINMRMVWVEGGEFVMGCTSEQGSDCDSDEKNVRRVTVDGFYIGMLEVTQSQWEKVMNTTIDQQKNKASASNTYGVGPDYPMYYVSWEEAMEFCRLLSQQTGKTYTLPTEAQWEYAARGGAKNEGTKYSGSHYLDNVAWYNGNSGNSTHVCGTKRANALGIYDMSGNVWEWCKDWYGDSYISYDVNNPQGASSGSARVLRGGSWISNASDCRVAYRNYYTPGYRYNYGGFRVVMIP